MRGMTKVIRWKYLSVSKAVARLEFNDGSGWRDYTQHPLKVSDYPIPGGSLGYATMQRLLKMGYVYEPAITQVEVLSFRCPGCDRVHEVYIKPNCDPQSGASWTWNGSLDRPTFAPSILLKIEYTDPTRSNIVCHSFVTDGKIQFLGDCTHALAGREVEIELIL